MLNWFKKKVEPEVPQNVLHAKAIGYCVDWWLLGLTKDSHSFAQDALILSFVDELLANGQFGDGSYGERIRYWTCFVAYKLVGDLILSRPATVREEVKAFMFFGPESDALTDDRLKQGAMAIDSYNGPQMGEAFMGSPGVRAEAKKTILERAGETTLSPEAHLLYAGIRHLFERSVVAASLENNETNFVCMVKRLARECMYSLEGDNADERAARHDAHEAVGVGDAPLHPVVESADRAEQPPAPQPEN